MNSVRDRINSIKDKIGRIVDSPLDKRGFTAEEVKQILDKEQEFEEQVEEDGLVNSYSTENFEVEPKGYYCGERTYKVTINGKVIPKSVSDDVKIDFKIVGDKVNEND